MKGLGEGEGREREGKGDGGVRGRKEWRDGTHSNRINPQRRQVHTPRRRQRGRIEQSRIPELVCVV